MALRLFQDRNKPQEVFEQLHLQASVQDGPEGDGDGFWLPTLPSSYGPSFQNQLTARKVPTPDRGALLRLDGAARQVTYASESARGITRWQHQMPRPTLPPALPDFTQPKPLGAAKEGKGSLVADKENHSPASKPSTQAQDTNTVRLLEKSGAAQPEEQPAHVSVRLSIRGDGSIKVQIREAPLSPSITTVSDLVKHKTQKSAPILAALHRLVAPHLPPEVSSFAAAPSAVQVAAVQGMMAPFLSGKTRLTMARMSAWRHGQAVLKPRWAAKTGQHQARNTGVLQGHSEARKVWKEAKAKSQRERMAALKADNLEAYMSMVQGAKNSQIDRLLSQTDACLRQLTDRLRATGAGIALQASQNSSDSTSHNQFSALQQSSVAWNSLAAAFDTDIPEQPAVLAGGQLREYQIKGLKWMVGLHDNNLNGILADEMGLGKTIQVIALVAYLVETRQEGRPFLIAAPSSVLPNWEKEFATWLPSLTLIAYKGNGEERERIYQRQIAGAGGKNRGHASRPHVVLTSYDFLMGKADRPRLSRVPWSYIIIDEGHRLKNSGCRLNTELKYYSTQHRLLLTGTPLQNSLDELWALLNFLMPQLFNSADDFDAWFGGAIKGCSASGDQDPSAAADDVQEAAMLSEEEMLIVTNRLHQVLRPFMLRRLKESVAGELPQKVEHLVSCEPSPYQQQLFALLEGQLGQPGGARGINNTVMELRSICNHPLISRLHVEGAENRLPRHPLPHEIRLCGKLEVLDRLLLKLKAGGHKVLLFCTMTRLLDVLEGYLEWRGLRYLRLDGATVASERGALVDEFNDPKSSAFIFLLSVRAGGVGLNLQAADTVIFYDTDWNAQVDAQAQARAHRIGQNRQVLVLRLQTRGTVEERIVQVAADKRSMADRSITGGFFDGKTSASERQRYLLELLKAGPAQGAGNGSRQLTDSQINELLARGDDELVFFEAQDQKLKEAEAAAWAKIRPNPEAPYCRVASADDSAELAAEAIAQAAPKDEDEGKEFGRGKRSRGDVAYSNMSQRQYNKLCKEGVALDGEGQSSLPVQRQTRQKDEKPAVAAKDMTVKVKRELVEIYQQQEEKSEEEDNKGTTPSSKESDGPEAKRQKTKHATAGTTAGSAAQGGVIDITEDDDTSTQGNQGASKAAAEGPPPAGTAVVGTDDRGRYKESVPGTTLLLAAAIPYKQGAYRPLVFRGYSADEAVGPITGVVPINTAEGHPCSLKPYIFKHNKQRIVHLHSAAFVRVNSLGPGDCMGVSRDEEGQLHMEVNTDRVKAAAEKD